MIGWMQGKTDTTRAGSGWLEWKGGQARPERQALWQARSGNNTAQHTQRNNGKEGQRAYAVRVDAEAGALVARDLDVALVALPPRVRDRNDVGDLSDQCREAVSQKQDIADRCDSARGHATRDRPATKADQAKSDAGQTSQQQGQLTSGGEPRMTRKRTEGRTWAAVLKAVIHSYSQTVAGSLYQYQLAPCEERGTENGQTSEAS